MKAPEAYVVPPALRGARFVRCQPGTRRSPMRVSRRAFEVAGLPIPEDSRAWNIYQLTQRQGEEWSRAVDAHIARFGGELVPCGRLVCVDCDQQLAIDHTVWSDGLRWLTDAGAEIGELLDVTQFCTVRTPGDPDRRHGQGWHLWARVDPEYPVRFGALKRCGAVEIKNRATAPGSPGYEVRYAPVSLPVLPGWIAELAGPPVAPALLTPAPRMPAGALRRLQAAITRLLDTQGQQGERNKLLFKAACRAGEARCDSATATAELMAHAAQVGLLDERDGEVRCLATIRQGLATGARDAMTVSRG
jgi:hypothetical protein